MSDTLPSELLVAPLPLIGFSGLDVSRNSVHKSIWDAFSCNRKADRAAVQFKLLPANYEFPVAKPKRASYEWYHPKGILKRNWMLKHLHVLPAVVVLFQDMEWNDPLWSEKQLQCVATLQSLKNALQERNTRICLVLLQKAAPLPPGEDTLASERAASLTSACGINNKMLFILPHTEHLLGYAQRLESAFLDMAQSYYTLMSKRIRTHRDQLTAAHTTLKIRHQFKLGFVAETRQDFSTGLKHYTQAYGTLDEIRIMDTNCLEIKTVAGFLNYKMCRLMFKLKMPRDAINQFIGHIEKYKSRIGFKDLIFEHYAWLSTQHSMFAELFCEAIKNGLPALQTQHPGIYFHKASEYLVKRREAFLQCCASLVSPTEIIPPMNLQNNNSMSLYTEFFGMRAVKTGEPISEQQINALVRDTEKSFNHSGAIINLLGQAMAQYKIYKCLRFRKKLAVDMAEEYFKSGDHAKALTLYSLMLPDYRQEKWSGIYWDVLLKTLRCALLAASLTDYISCSIEALALRVCTAQNERVIVLENLWKVYQCTPPISQSQIAPEIQELWEHTFINAKTPIRIDLDKLTNFVELCATFENDALKNDDVVNVRLIAKVLTDVPIKLRNFVVLLSDGTTVFKLQTCKYLKFASLLELRTHHDKVDGKSTIDYLYYDSDLKLDPDMYYEFYYTVEAQQFLENTQLHVVRIEANMGSDKLYVVLTKTTNYARRTFRHHTRCRDLDDNITIHPICRIIPTFHLHTQTNLDSDNVIDAKIPTMLVNEYFPVVITVSNQFNVFLQNVGLSITVPEHLRNRVFLTTDIAPSRQKLHANLHIDIGEISTHDSTTVSYYIFSLLPTLVQIQQKVWYTLDIPPPKISTSSALTIITVGGNQSTNSSADNTPDMARVNLQLPTQTSAAMGMNNAPVIIEFVDEQRLRKTREQTLNIECDAEIDFTGRFYTLSKKPLLRIYRGENFLFRANIEIRSSTPLDILETYFICDHNLVQSTYSFSRKKHTKTYERNERLEDVIVLRTNTTLQNWITVKEYERSKGGASTNAPPENIFERLQSTRRISRHANNRINDGSSVGGATAIGSNPHSGTSNTAAGSLNKSLMAKIPNNMIIVGAATPSATTQSAMLSSVINSSIMSTSSHSDDGKLNYSVATDATDSSNSIPGQNSNTRPAVATSRIVHNKAIEAIQATGHCRGFIRNVLIPEPLVNTASTTVANSNQLNGGSAGTTTAAQNNTIFGVYCIKWRRHSDSSMAEENESRFVITGLDIEEPPLNIYASIEERMFVKMPMTFKIVLKNPTAKVLHLIAILSISNTDNFICSGHKQLDLTISAFAEKELVYNLYPLCVGWQQLPELTLEYNTQSDPSKDEAQNNLLSELVQRAVPKKVFVLPPLKQLSK